MSYKFARNRTKVFHDGPALPNRNKYDRKIGTPATLPPKMSKIEYSKLLKHWYDKLSAEGFTDIERYDFTALQADPGFKATFLSPKAHSSEVNNFTQDKIDYFRYCRAFLAHADFDQLFEKDAWLYKTIFEMHCEGWSYRKIAKHFRGESVPPEQHRPKASEFWSHTHVAIVLQVMWPWHKTHPEGLDVVE